MFQLCVISFTFLMGIAILAFILLTFPLSQGLKLRLGVSLVEEIYTLSLILYYQLFSTLSKKNFAYMLVFGCFIQFGGTEIYLATVPNTAINFMDKSFFQLKDKIKCCIVLYYILNFLCGIVILVMTLIQIYFCVVGIYNTYKREGVIKKLEDKIFQVVGNQGQCSICLMEYQIGEKCYDLSCGHVFHTNCLEDWLKEQLNCPLCRGQIKEEDGFE